MCSYYISLINFIYVVVVIIDNKEFSFVLSSHNKLVSVSVNFNGSQGTADGQP